MSTIADERSAIADGQDGVVLVTGATGHVGRNVVSGLLRTGAAVRAVARRPDSARLPQGVEVVPGDLSDPKTLAGNLDGVGTVFLLWPFFTTEGAPAFLDMVGKHARRIVYLSSLAVRDDLEEQPDAVWAGVERLIGQSGLEWTFLRPSGFATNALMWAPQVRTGDVVRWPYGGAARPLIHERDIADVAVQVLTRDGHGGARYLLTGPQVLTQVEQVRVIGEAIGRPLRYEEISPEVARRQLLAEGWPPSFADAALGYWASIVAEPEPAWPAAVEEITGAPARTFREWASEHAGDFL